MRRLLVAGDESLQRVWLEIVAYLRRTNSLDDVRHKLEMGQVGEAIDGIRQAAEHLASEWARQFLIAGAAAATAARDATGRMISFSGDNWRARSALDLKRLETLSSLTADVRALVESVIRRGLARGDNPIVVARTIVSSLGLTPEFEQLVDTYERQLRAGQFRDASRRALADGRYATRRQATDQQIDAMVDNYRASVTRYRAELIARTEQLAALHEGVETAIQQAIDAGDLSPGEINASWRCAMRTTSRDSHVEANGNERGADGLFEMGSGARLRYPGDPRAPARERCNCTCVIQYRMA